MESKDSIEKKIILNLKHEYELFKQKSKDSLIRKWLNNHGIKSPVLSKSTFKYKVTFIGAKANPKYTGYGIIIYPTPNPFSKAFIGELKNGERDGEGLRLLNNKLFIGNYKKDKKNGKAIVLKIEGEKSTKIFDGDYKQGNRHGDCYIEEDDHIFEGKVLNGLYNGFCKIYYKNGNYFEGTMTKGVISGSGIIKYSNGDIYEGGFLNNKRYGEGSYIFKSDIESMVDDTQESLDKFISMKKMSSNLKNFIMENKDNKISKPKNSSSITKSALYTDWSYSTKRPQEEFS